LKVFAVLGSMDTDLLVGANCVTFLSYSGGSLDRFGRIGRINEAIEKNKIDVEEFTGLSMSLRFMAGSLGMPFVPTKTLLGTDMLRNLLNKKSNSVKVINNPFSEDEKFVALKAINTDYAVIHAQMADEKGNVIIEGPRWDLDLALSAKKLFVTVEKIVSNKYIKKYPEKVIIPSVSVYKIIEVPYGAFPTVVFKHYDYCSTLLQEYAKANRDQNTFNEFLEKYILSSRNHYDFLRKSCSLEELFRIRAEPHYGYSVELRGKDNE